MTHKRFTEWLQQQMQKKNHNYATMAISTGLHATTISDIIKHQRDVRLSTFIALCKAVDADPAKVLKEINK